MKQLKKISLVSLSKDELKRRELSQLIGGQNCCICSCGGDAAIAIGGTSNNFGIQDPAGGYGTGAFH